MAKVLLYFRNKIIDVSMIKQFICLEHLILLSKINFLDMIRLWFNKPQAIFRYLLCGIINNLWLVIIIVGFR